MPAILALATHTCALTKFIFTCGLQKNDYFNPQKCIKKDYYIQASAKIIQLSIPFSKNLKIRKSLDY